MKFKKLVTIGLTSAIMFGVFGSYAKADDDGFRYIAGKDRVETSILASNYVDSDILVLANAYSFADALSSYNLVASKGAKLILVKDDTDISGILRDKGIRTVYLVGGEKTLKGKPVEDAKKIADEVNRVSGRDRYETNEKSLQIGGYESVGVADGRNYPDALAASGLLKKENLGLMLVDGSKTYATSRDVKYIFGGINSVRQIGGNRLAGGNRYDTCTTINMKIDNAKNIAFVSGKNFADALSSLNIINYAEDTSIVLTEGDLGTYVNDKSLNLFAVGGELKSKIQNRVPNDGRNNPIAQSNSKEIWMRDYTRTRKKFKISNWNDVSSLHINIISGNEVMIVTYKDGKKVTIDSSPGRFVDVLQESYELPLERVDEFSNFVGDVYNLARIIKGDYQ